MASTSVRRAASLRKSEFMGRVCLKFPSLGGNNGIIVIIHEKVLARKF